MSSQIRSILSDHWKALEARPTSSSRKVRTSDLPVDVGGKNLLAGVDASGVRHVMIPIEAHQHVGTNLGGANLRVTEISFESNDIYQRYADLCCVNPDLVDLFTDVSGDVILAVAAEPHSALRAMNNELQRWQSLFAASTIALNESKLLGLFAELLLLRMLLKRDSSAARRWSGPSGDRHDFSHDSIALEVKASSKTEGRRVAIHGLDQLDPPHDGELWLLWTRLVKHADGLRFIKLVDEVLSLTDDPTSVVKLLERTGYRLADRKNYTDVSFRTVESAWYSVDKTFPRLVNSQLTAAGVPIEVANVTYSIDLPDPGSHALSLEETEAVLSAFVTGNPT